MSQGAQESWSKIQLVLNSLKLATNPNNFGLKQYLQQKISRSISTLHPTSRMDLHQWKKLAAFHDFSEALSHLFEPTQGRFQQMLVHPLTPPSVVDWLAKYGEVQTLDISKDTLAWEPTEVLSFVQNTSKLDLLVFYAANGLYAEITSALDRLSLNNRKVPVLIIIDHPGVNHELLELLSRDFAVNFVWQLGESQVSKEFMAYTSESKDIAALIWYAAWQHRGQPAVAVPKDSLTALDLHKRWALEAFLYLLLQDYSKVSSIKGFWSKQIVGRFFLEQKIQSPQQAQTILATNWPSMAQGAVPDVFFTLALRALDQTPEHNILSAQALYNILSAKLAKVPEGSLEIPPLFLGREYLEYFFFTTDKLYWRTFFEKKDLALREFRLSDVFDIDRNQIPNAVFVERYGVRLDLRSQ